LDLCRVPLGLNNVRTRTDDFRVHYELCIRASQDSHISARAEKSADVAAKALNGDFCGGGLLQRRFDEVVARPGESPRRLGHAAAAEML
jgi:hypothetical protein